MIPVFISFFLLIQSFSPASLLVASPSASPDNSPATLCLPGIYMTTPQDCLPLGPSSYLTQMASFGMEFPLRSTPSHPIDRSLGEVPYLYAILGDGPTPVYASIQDAISGKNAIR